MRMGSGKLSVPISGLVCLLVASLICCFAFPLPADDLQTQAISWANGAAFAHAAWVVALVGSYALLVTRLKRESKDSCKPSHRDWALLLVLWLLAFVGIYLIARTAYYNEISRTAMWLTPFESQNTTFVWLPSNTTAIIFGHPPPFANETGIYYTREGRLNWGDAVKWIAVRKNGTQWVEIQSNKTVCWYLTEVPTALDYLTKSRR